MIKGKVKLVGGKELQGRRYTIPRPPDLTAHVADLRKRAHVLWVRKGNKLVGAGEEMDKTCSVCFAMPHEDTYAVYEENFGPRKDIESDIDYHDGDAMKQLKRLYKLRPDERLVEFFNGPVGVLNKKLNDKRIMAQIKGEPLPSKKKVNDAAKSFLRTLDLK